MDMSHKNIPGIVAVFETLLLFAMGVMGNKISEELSIAPVALVTLTGIGLAAMAVISYFNSLRIETHLHLSPSIPEKLTDSKFSSAKTKTKITIRNLIPRTMLGIFPFGILLGFVCGMTIPNFIDFLDKWFYISIGIPFWDSLPFTLSLTDAEALGIYIGTGASILLAIFLDGYLGAALSIGFGLAFPVTLINAESYLHDEGITFFGHLLGFIFIGVLLIIMSPLIGKIRPAVFNFMQNAKRVLTQPRI